MSVVFTPYDPVTGKLKGHIVTCEAGTEIYADMGYVWVDGAHNSDTHYILNGAPTERPASPVTRTDLTLHDVPNGATLVINGESYAAAGTVELEFPIGGAFEIRVECFPYLDFKDTIFV